MKTTTNNIGLVGNNDDKYLNVFVNESEIYTKQSVY